MASISEAWMVSGDQLMLSTRYYGKQILRAGDGGLQTGRGSDLERVVVLFKLDPVGVEEPRLPE